MVQGHGAVGGWLRSPLSWHSMQGSSGMLGGPRVPAEQQVWGRNQPACVHPPACVGPHRHKHGQGPGPKGVDNGDHALPALAGRQGVPGQQGCDLCATVLHQRGREGTQVWLGGGRGHKQGGGQPCDGLGW